MVASAVIPIPARVAPANRLSRARHGNGCQGRYDGEDRIKRYPALTRCEYGGEPKASRNKTGSLAAGDRRKCESLPGNWGFHISILSTRIHHTCLAIRKTAIERDPV